MNFQQIQAQLLDLPTTFTRQDQTFAQWIDALTAALTLYCQSQDALQSELNFNNSTDGWIDVWGTLAGVARRSNESNEIYKNRIQETILAWRDSVVAMLVWLTTIENVNVTITENLPTVNSYAVGYNISFEPTVSLSQINAILANLIYVRPAGVPFNVYYIFGGSYLNDINYFGGAPTLYPTIGRVTGAYLAQTSSPISASIASSTNNVVSELPSLLFTDPTLNP